MSFGPRSGRCVAPDPARVENCSGPPISGPFGAVAVPLWWGEHGASLRVYARRCWLVLVHSPIKRRQSPADDLHG